MFYLFNVAQKVLDEDIYLFSIIIWQSDTREIICQMNRED